VTLPFSDYASLSRHEREQLQRIVESHHGLDDVFAWGRAQSPPVSPSGFVKQDEFTHDVIVPFPNDRWVVYGTT
jgi:hypothetical protein